MSRPPALTPLARGRLCILLGAVLWSLGGAFNKVLTKPTPLGLDEPAVHSLQIACFRVLFAGLVLVPAIRPRDVSFRPFMIVMVLSFTLMNASYVTAQALGTAANAVLLQYTAPLWLYLASVWWLGEAPDRRNFTALFVAAVGVALILLGGWQDAQLGVVALGLFSGVTYAGVMIGLRVLRDSPSAWLTLLNHLLGGLVLLPFVLVVVPPDLTAAQWATLVLFGAVQMGLPYFLVARGMRSVSPQEAGTITLIEPLINPLWAYLISGEVPSPWTFVGGSFILGALAWRYWPRRA
ncbi:MAG: EamA family transporter [Planctomycetes bacterium]|nr:EamA family transporter [Planctomycetota bacterium]